jgi:hypothetical protein
MGGNLDWKISGSAETTETKIPTLAKTARMEHPAKPKPYNLLPAT